MVRVRLTSCAVLVLAAAAASITLSAAFAATLPGTIPGSFTVGDQGDGRYTIPIAAPAATGGLRPSLALSYNHLSGNGLAGMRWTLAGISVISRCQQTYAQDTKVVAVNYSTTDRFCLDGQRLVNFAGDYGLHGTEYRTELETFQRVFQQNVVGGGPQYFYVQHGNGSTSYYGYTADSRVERVGSTAVRLWYLSYTVDQFGNQINYSYSENTSTGEVVPTEVTWTSNPGQSLSPRYKIALTYETRPDARSGHDSGGAPWAKTQRIKKIAVTYNGAAISTYDLTYRTPPPSGTGRSQLEKVKLSRGGDSLPETVFTLQDGTKSWGGLVGTGKPTGTSPLVGDMNGDGRQDVWFCSTSWQVYPGQADGMLGTAIGSGISCATNPEQARVIDYNGDGRRDLLYRSGTNWNVLQSTGSAFSNVSTGLTTSSMQNPAVIDLDGDGLSDVVYDGGGSLAWRRNTGGSFASPVGVYVPTGTLSGYGPVPSLNSSVPMDANGDGRTDLWVYVQECEVNPNDPYQMYCQNVYYLLIATGTGWNTFTQIPITTLPEGYYLSNFRAGDINGDGLQDLLYVHGLSSKWFLQRYLGGATLSSTTNTQIPSTGADKVMIVDYDGDGRHDLVRVDPSLSNSYLIHRSDGTTLPSSYTESLSSSGASAATAFAADVSGDGFPEIVRASGSTWAVHKHQSALPDVVTTFANGLGHEVDVTYESLAQTSHYLVNPAIVPPAPYVQVYKGPRSVVTLEDQDDGIGGTRNFSYMYGTVLLDRSGRGWLSVEFNFRNDIDAGVFYVNTFRQDWPYAGNPSRRHTIKQGASVPVQDNTYVWDKATNSTPTPDIHFVRLESTTTKDYEVGGVANGQHLRTIVDDPVYETLYGQVTSRTTTITDPVTAETWTSTTNFNPTADIDDWCLGQAGLVETTNTLPNFTSAVRKVRHVWNSINCSLAEKIDESETSPAKQLKTVYSLDAYGNPNIITEDSVDTTAVNRGIDFDFDSFGQCPTSVRIGGGLNLTTTLTCDYLTGQGASEKGPDGLTTSWLYDPFGRLAQEIRPVGSTTFSYTACGTCWPQNAAYYVRAQDTDGSDSFEFFDELGRTVGKSWKAPLGNEGRQETRYNALGQVEQGSQPYLSAEPVYWTSYLYDVIGRLTSENAPVSELQPSGATTLYEYRGHDLWITDAENNTTKYTHNAARQIKQVIDAMNGTTAYTYKHFGELATLTDAELNQTTLNYDARGFKTSLADPNMGNWAYDTDVFGDLTNQRSPLTAAPNWTTTLTYDPAGRIKTRCDVPEGASATACSTDDTTTWNYYSGTAAQANRGKLNSIVGPGNSQTYTYALPHGLPSQIQHTVGTNFLYNMTYDSQGRLDLLTYPTSTSSYRFKVDYDYDVWGHLTAAKDGNTPSLVYYRLDAADAAGRELTATFGNGLHEYRDYDRAAGHLLSIQTDLGLGAAIQNLSFTHDEVGNVLTRTNAKISKTETFTYDDLNRLYTMQVSGLSAVTMGYSAAGRITSRTDLGAYTYTGGCGGGPFAVKNAAGKAYCYDAAGRMTSRGGSPITWFSYDLPKRIDNGTASSEFTYGVDRARITQTRKTGSTTNATITYIGDLVEREVASGTTTWRHYVSAGGRVVAQVNRVNTTNTAQYLHRDHQGSVVEVTSAAGALVQSLAYDAWGLRRNPANWAPLGSPFGGTQPTKRGYTGHEHLDNVELTHMNGRVQDPRIARFISADPFVQAPYHSQSLNRYSFVWNNPMTLIDPSGFQARCDNYCGDICQLYPYGPECNSDPCADYYGSGECMSLGEYREREQWDARTQALKGGGGGSGGGSGGNALAPQGGVPNAAVIGSTGVLTWPGSWPAAGEAAKQAGTRVGVRGIPIVGGILGAAIPTPLGNGECIGDLWCEGSVINGDDKATPSTNPTDSLDVTPASGDPNNLGGPDRKDDRSTPGTKYPNRYIDRTPDQIRESLTGRGFQSSRSGPAELWTRGDRRYVIRPSDSSSSTSNVKIDVFIRGRKIGELIPK